MPEKITNIAEYIIGAVGTLGSIIFALVGYFGNRVIATQDAHDKRMDKIEMDVATNARDLELLRREHDRELERCHREKK